MLQNIYKQLEQKFSLNAIILSEKRLNANKLCSKAVFLTYTLVIPLKSIKTNIFFNHQRPTNFVNTTKCCATKKTLI